MSAEGHTPPSVFLDQRLLRSSQRFVGMRQNDRQTVEQNNGEADRRNDEGSVDAGHVGDPALHRGDDRGAKDGHDKAGGTDLGISANIFQRQTVDGREHK